MGGNPALDVVNVSDPAHPFLVKTYPAKSADILISEGNKIYYRTMDQGLGGYTGFQILDVSTPTNPTPAGQYITERGYGAYQVQVVNNLAYVVGDHMTIQFADTHLSLRVEDVHDIYHPKLLADFVPKSGGGIWYTWGVPPVQVISDTAYIITGFGQLEIVDMSNPISPTVLSSYGTGTFTGIQVVGELAYIPYFVDTPQAGLYVVDISNPYSPTTLSNYTATQASGVSLVSIDCLKVLNGLAYLGVDTELQIVDVANPISLTLVSTYTTSVSAKITGIEVAGNWAYVAFEGGGLEIVNVSDPAHPTRTGSYTASGTMTHIQSLGNTIYIVVQGIEIQAVDVTDPASPSLVYRYLTDARFIQATSDSIGQLGYIAAGNSGVQVFNP